MLFAADHEKKAGRERIPNTTKVNDVNKYSFLTGLKLMLALSVAVFYRLLGRIFIFVFGWSF